MSIFIDGRYERGDRVRINATGSEAVVMVTMADGAVRLTYEWPPVWQAPRYVDAGRLFHPRELEPVAVAFPDL